MDLLKNRRMMMKDSIPYQRVEYLGSDSTAYIDTGIAGGVDTLTIKCAYKFTTHVNYGAIYGNYQSDNHNGIRLILNNVSGQSLVNNNYICTTTGNTVVSVSPNQKHTVINTHTLATVDGSTTTVTKTTRGTANSKNIALFARNVDDPITTRNIGLTVYSFTIWNGDALVLNLVPVRVGTVGYMYDTVSKQLLGASGSGSLSVGPDI